MDLYHLCYHILSRHSSEYGQIVKDAYEQRHESERVNPSQSLMSPCEIHNVNPVPFAMVDYSVHPKKLLNTLKIV